MLPWGGNSNNTFEVDQLNLHSIAKLLFIFFCRIIFAIFSSEKCHIERERILLTFFICQ